MHVGGLLHSSARSAPGRNAMHGSLPFPADIVVHEPASPALVLAATAALALLVGLVIVRRRNRPKDGD